MLVNNTISTLTNFWPLFFEGLVITLWLSFLTVFLGTILGTLITFVKTHKFKVFRFIATAYIEIIRGTPLLLQLYAFAFLLPMLTNIRLPMFQSVLIAMVLNSSAYVAEIIRSGINAVDKGQTEAARSLGISSKQTMIRVILPQAVKNILPTLGNEFIMVIKETALASVFFLGDLMTVVNVIRGSHFLTIEPLIIAAFIYFSVTFSLSKLVAFYERRLSASD